MTRRNVQEQWWVSPWFSPDSDGRLSLNFHRFFILYRSCDTQSVGLGQDCLPKVSNGFKSNSMKWGLGLKTNSKCVYHKALKWDFRTTDNQSFCCNRLRLSSTLTVTFPSICLLLTRQYPTSIRTTLNLTKNVTWHLFGVSQIPRELTSLARSLRGSG